MRFRNTKVGRRHYAQELDARSRAVVANVAKAIYRFQVPAGAGDELLNPEWTGFFRANWNVSVNAPDYGTVAPSSERAGSRPKTDAGRFLGMVQPDKAIDFFGDDGGRYASLSDIVYISNGTEYAQWLNNGGLDTDYGVRTHLRVWPRKHGPGTPGIGSRFMEACVEHVELNMPRYITAAVNRKKRAAGEVG